MKNLNDIKNYKLSEINWMDNYKKITLWTSKGGKLSWTTAKEVQISLKEAIELLGNKDYKIYNSHQLFDAKLTIPYGRNGRYYEQGEIRIKLGSMGEWRCSELRIKLRGRFKNKYLVKNA